MPDALALYPAAPPAGPGPTLRRHGPCIPLSLPLAVPRPVFYRNAPPLRLCSYERVAEGEARVIVVVNAARNSWQDGSYGLWVGGGGTFKQVYCSQVRPWQAAGGRRGRRTPPWLLRV